MSIFRLDSSHFVLDQPDTWPTGIPEYLTTNRAELAAYVREEQRIDQLATTDISLRIKRPPNKHAEAWDDAVAFIKSGIGRSFLVGFHCTRLIEEEIQDVQSNGLRPLDLHFAEERIKRLHIQGLISAQEEAVLLANNKTASNNRSGLLFVFLCVSTLTNESGLIRLFKYWGGEAIYALHKHNSIARDALLRIGVPCIVIVSVPSSDIQTFSTIEERIIRQWLQTDDTEKASQDADVTIKRQLKVIEIITASDPRFEQLTKYSTWRSNKRV